MIRWREFLLAVLLIELTPGPNMGWLAALTLKEGRKSGLAAACGIALGLIILGALAIVALDTLTALDRRALSWLRYPGALILLGLAIVNWREAGRIPTAERHDGLAIRSFLIGLATNVVNFKAFLFFALVAPEFVEPKIWAFNVAVQAIGVSVTIATLVHFLIVALAGQARNWLMKSSAKLVGRVMAVGVACLATWLVFQD